MGLLTAFGLKKGELKSGSNLKFSTLAKAIGWLFKRPEVSDPQVNLAKKLIKVGQETANRTRNLRKHFQAKQADGLSIPFLNI